MYVLSFANKYRILFRWHVRLRSSSIRSSSVELIKGVACKAPLINMPTAIIVPIVTVVIGSVVMLTIAVLIIRCVLKIRMQSPRSLIQCFTNPTPLVSVTANDSRIETEPVEIFIKDILKDKPVRFTTQNIIDYTGNFSEKVGSGGFGVVYKGELPNGIQIAVKVLHQTKTKRADEQFMAEVATIGRTYHINLVRLYGFCCEGSMRALVYEYLEKGSLDRYLFDMSLKEWGKLHSIATGTAKGIRYLHEECRKMIVHYDIKPANILLTNDFVAKVADFGLAMHSDRENYTGTVKGGRGTPGYAAPEMWAEIPVTEKCDVYSFGMLLFEILGRRRNLDFNQTESKEWFPRWVWEKFEEGDLRKVVSLCDIEEKDREKAERMCEVALWCIQYEPEARPSMSGVVRMLEGEQEIVPPINPFKHISSLNENSTTSTSTTAFATTWGSSSTVNLHTNVEAQ